jgi:hypothetical protein
MVNVPDGPAAEQVQGFTDTLRAINLFSESGSNSTLPSVLRPTSHPVGITAFDF